jgi:site-specific DNA recombinase
MKQAIIYTRFSPRRNADQSESCEVQRAYCEEYAAKRGLTVFKVIDDPDVSGADEFRPKLWEAIDSLDKGHVLLAYKRDRLARNVYLSEQIIRAVKSKGASIEAVSGDISGDGPEHTMIRQIIAAMAEYERKLIAQRTSHSMRHHQNEGRRMGRFPPYGWNIDPDDEKRMVPNEREREALSALYALADSGMSALDVARSLNADRRECARGSRGWTSKSVSDILRRDRLKTG